MTAAEAYELITQGGAACERFGPYRLIGGLAVIASRLPDLTEHLQQQGLTPPSQLRIQFTTDERYQPFPARSIEAEVLGLQGRLFE